MLLLKFNFLLNNNLKLSKVLIIKINIKMLLILMIINMINNKEF